MTLKEKDIDILIEEAASSEEFIINLYQKVFAGVWEAIEQLNGSAWIEHSSPGK